MLITREEIEQRERDTLAPYAVKSADSKGRYHEEDEPRYRTAFQRDRDRVLHTSAFRRLEYKTQVLINYEGDYFRTRLTHTLEVAQIGRSLARTLGLNEDLVEVICLVHDIGHPPFGHSGEMILSELMEDHGGFDHNQQSLRIVTTLEKRYAEFPGLNLTFETREGIVKHETEYDVSRVEPEYEPDLHANLEAQIANVADELTYTAHDLDDGLYGGLLQPARLKGIALWEQCKAELGFNDTPITEVIRHRIVRRLIGILVRDVVAASAQRIADANPQSVADVQALDQPLLGHSDEMRGKVRELKDFLYQNMYRHYRVVRMQQKAERFIRELFKAYINEAAQLPHSALDRLEQGVDSKERVVCDYLAGMTDRYALQEYQKLFDPFMRP